MLLEFDIDFGHQASVTVPEGDSLQFVIGSPMGHKSAAAVNLHTGGDAASFVEFRTRELENDSLLGAGEPSETAHSGSILALAAGTGTPVGDITAPYFVSFEFNLARNTQILEIKLEQTAGLVDPAWLMLQLFDQQRMISAGTAPRSQQSIFLAAPSLEEFHGKDLTILVMVQHGAMTSFDLRVYQA